MGHGTFRNLLLHNMIGLWRLWPDQKRVVVSCSLASLQEPRLHLAGREETLPLWPRLSEIPRLWIQQVE